MYLLHRVALLSRLVELPHLLVARPVDSRGLELHILTGPDRDFGRRSAFSLDENRVRFEAT